MTIINSDESTPIQIHEFKAVDDPQEDKTQNTSQATVNFDELSENVSSDEEFKDLVESEKTENIADKENINEEDTRSINMRHTYYLKQVSPR